MRTDVPRANPFVLMMAPERVLDAMKKSDALRHLQHKVFRPLDARPARPDDADVASFDAAIDKSGPLAAARKRDNRL
ncbi:hypothetical protein [Polaromonas sp. SM01]|uniref:hypothetical protein n=1 Tax=Polaromonas sp. SM01 TaxID=3085630 RepID=UPI002981B203|nr:hypothetical protein [Polaromonas sp. SM01]MDW5442404.1 hypothetical protein [Polaromonas sp. SM01]